MTRPDAFLRRVIDQRDREQGIGVEQDADRLAQLDAERIARLDTLLRLKCSTPGCERRPQEGTNSDKCAICRRTQDAGTQPAEEEEEMETEKRCTDCNHKIRADNGRGICGDRAACRARQAEKNGVTAAAPPNTAIGLLEARRAELQLELGKIEKALEVLR